MEKEKLERISHLSRLSRERNLTEHLHSKAGWHPGKAPSETE